MIRNLFMILFRPGKTLDRLVEERKYGQSWGATWTLVGVGTLFTFFISLLFFRMVNQLVELDPMSEEMTGGRVMIPFIIGIVFSVIGLIITFTLGRFFFSWIVMLGLRISASEQYPRDPAERRERARMLRMIHPYTLWIYTVPTLLVSLLLLVPLDLTVMLDFADPMTGEYYLDPDAMTTMMGWVVGYLLVMLISFAMYVYMIVVRTMGIKRIYSISGTQAFWGPFLIYFLIYFVLGVAYFGLIFLNFLLFDPLPTTI